jgi:hypothetical protein
MLAVDDFPLESERLGHRVVVTITDGAHDWVMPSDRHAARKSRRRTGTWIPSSVVFRFVAPGGKAKPSPRLSPGEASSGLRDDEVLPVANNS